MDYKKLLKVIFEDDAETDTDKLPDNFPDTDAEKIGYAAYVLTKSLERIGNAIHRLYRCEALCKINPPNIITHNEARMALEHLVRVKGDIYEAYNETLTVFERTKNSEGKPQ